MAGTQAGWYDDGTGTQRWWDGQAWTSNTRPQEPGPGGLGGFVERIAAEANAGAQPRPAAQNASYVVLQVILKEKMWETGSGNLTELEMQWGRTIGQMPSPYTAGNPLIAPYHFGGY